MNFKTLIYHLIIAGGVFVIGCTPSGGGGDDCDPMEDAGCVCRSILAESVGEPCEGDEPGCKCELESGGEVTGGEVTGGEVTGGEVTGGEVTGGEVTGGEVTDLCAGVTCPEGEVCNALTSSCIPEETECPNPCETLGGQLCAPNGAISTCEDQGECLSYSTPVACPENRVCGELDGQVACVCASDLIDDGAGGCVEPSRWPENVIMIQLDNEGNGEATGDFSEGESADLGEWGTPSGANCWETSQRFNFWDGKPRYFALSESIGAWKTVTITVTPDSADQDPEVFAYLQPENQRVTPPESEGIGMCKTSYSASSLGNAGEIEQITFDTYSTLTPQEVLIGVANESMGEVTVRVEVRDMAERCFGANPNLTAWPPYVREIELDQEVDMYTSRGVYRAELSAGAPMCELDWVWGQFCDVTPQQVYYEGHHMMFALDQPEYSLQVVTVTPDPGVEVTLWGYSQGVTNYSVPPQASGIACEVSHPYDGLNRPTNPGESETIEFYAFRNPYHTLFGVTGFGPDGTEGGFTITVDQYRTASDACETEDFEAVQGLENWDRGPRVNVLSVPAGEEVVRGDLSTGEPLCGLSWMSNSFCVPDTQFHYFGGNHVFYALEEPLAPGEIVEVEVTPAPDAEVSLYGYLTNTETYSVPPVVSSSMCEASHRYDLQHRPGYGEVERIQFQNPSTNNGSYHVFFGVAGYTESWPPRADDIGIGAEGEYRVKVTKQVSPPAHCEESLPGASYAAWPGNVNLISLNDELRGSTAGDLATGDCVNLDFAQNSFCFPGTQDQHFEGNHVFYALDTPMPPNSIARVTVTPNPDVEVSLYGYNMPEGTYSIPPMTRGVVSCEASYTLAGIEHTPNPGEPETIEFLNPTNNSYEVFFAVAGDRTTGLEGAYTVEVELLVTEPHCEESLMRPMSNNEWPADVNLLSVRDGEVEAQNNLNEGSCVHLDFAEDAFCFPGTQNQHFQGNHIFYALDTPQPPNSVLTITVEPDPDVEVSLYGWQANPSDYTVPPYANTTVCEASHTQNGVQHAPNPGVSETIRFYNPSTNPNSYGIFFAVAGDRDTGTEGRFTVKVSLDVGETFCAESLDRELSSSCWPSDVNVIPRGEVTGNLRSGSCTNLSWASNSSVACFPETESDMFDGSHVFYALEEPLGPMSRLRITASPDRQQSDLSLYAYMLGEGTCYVPPAVGGVVSCEASHARFNMTNPGEPESVLLDNPTNNSYEVLIGVAGAGGLEAGSFTLTVEDVR